MPMQADPQATFEVALLRHKDLPADQRPVLVFRYMRSRYFKQLDELMSRFGQITVFNDLEPAMNEMESFIKRYLADWRNQADEDGKPLAFDREQYDLVIDRADVPEIAQALRVNQLIDAGDKKKSAQLSPASTEPAASPAPAEPEPQASPASPTPSG